MLRRTSLAGPADDDGQEHEQLPGAAGGKFTASHARLARARRARLGPGRSAALGR
ncbi:hypothetical protein [Streptomyces sp. NPDC014676]|uniref:hypothetical protein n=1 Tax=Streptomyces sp. NPDC014676 TaxID=3364879 RepID=UPI003702FC9B